MYFIKYHPLKERLRARAIGDREALPYLVLWAAAEVVVCAIPSIAAANAWDVASTVLSLGAAVGGTLYAYRRNGGAQGYDLIHKFVILAFVVGIRFFLVVFPVGIALYGAASYLGIATEATGPFDVAMVIIIEIAYYQRIATHIADTHQGTSEPQREPER